MRFYACAIPKMKIASIRFIPRVRKAGSNRKSERIPPRIDASLLPAPLYGQVPVFAGRDRGIIDLVGIDHTGRLVVIELKATEDLQLPFQAIDYWMRVRKHLLAGDFERQGYFPGQAIRRESPRILLVAPALEFHSTMETQLRALNPAIDIARIGLAADWRQNLRVMFRLRAPSIRNRISGCG